MRVEPPDRDAVDRLRHQDPLRVGASEELRRHGAALGVVVPYFTDTAVGYGILDNLLVTYIALFVIACFTLLIGVERVGGLFSLLDVVPSFLSGLGQGIRRRSLLFLRRAGARYDRIFDNARLRRALAAERARADRLAVELATLRGMNHMCTALANRVGAYNS